MHTGKLRAMSRSPHGQVPFAPPLLLKQLLKSLSGCISSPYTAGGCNGRRRYKTNGDSSQLDALPERGMILGTELVS